MNNTDSFIVATWTILTLRHINMNNTEANQHEQSWGISTWTTLIHSRNECLFFLVHWEWIGERDKQIAWTAKIICSVLQFIPSWTQIENEKTLIPNIFTICFQHRPFLKFSEKSYKFKILAVLLNLIWCITHSACDLSNCRTTCWPWFFRNWIEKFIM